MPNVTNGPYFLNRKTLNFVFILSIENNFSEKM